MNTFTSDAVPCSSDVTREGRVTGPVGHCKTTQTDAPCPSLTRLRASRWPSDKCGSFLCVDYMLPSRYRCYLYIFARLRRDGFVSIQLLTETTIIATGVNLDKTNGCFCSFVKLANGMCVVCVRARAYVRAS